MQFHHKSFEDQEITTEMQRSGYQFEKPAILPQDLKNLCEDDPLLLQCYESMISYCKRYAHDVFSMMYEQKVIEEMRIHGEDTQEDFQELKVIDENRHRLHTAVMDSVNIMSKKLAEKGKDNSWMQKILGSKHWENARAEYATFALLTFYNLYSSIESSSVV